MFFPRLRRHMKWVFLLLALVFGIGFLAFGVGAGGTGIGDAIRDFVGAGSADIPSIEDAEKKVEESPNDTEALRNLANAYLAENQNEKAADALERYAALKPGDEDVLRQLAGLYLIEADAARREASQLQLQSIAGTFSSTAFNFPETSGFLAALGDNVVEQALASGIAARAEEASQRASDLFARLVPVYERLLQAAPDDLTLYIQLGDAADAANDATKAIDAYKKYLELAPGGEFVEYVQGQLQQLGATPEA
jgi:tetratricopeptide (TPR) repeat protein